MTAESEREPPATFHAFAISEIAGERQLRDGAITPSTVVGGVSPPNTYPKGPDWTVDPVGTEPSLNFDVNAMQPTGEAFEIRRSLEAKPPELVSPLAAPGVPGGSAAASPSSSFLGVERAEPPSFSKNKV
jgi:hypothetical protein